MSNELVQGLVNQNKYEGLVTWGEEGNFNWVIEKDSKGKRKYIEYDEKGEVNLEKNY